MKKLFIVAGAVAFFAACTSPKANTEAEEAVEVEDVAESTASEYVVNAAESTVAWEGSKITGDNHTGNIGISMGTMSVEDAAIVAGNFVLDMSSISVSDEGMDDETKGKLVGHLSSPDFFSVEENKTASFEIASGSADSLTGNLTIKGITKAITIPYTLSAQGDAATVTSSFSIDRTQWDVKYGSGSIFDGLGDKAINDAIEFDITLKATK